MAREPDRWFDRCVRLDGYVSWYYFYSGPKGRYRSLATDKADHQNDGWLGLYFEDRRELRKPSGRVSLVGIVDDCTRSHQRATAKAGPDVVVMSLGYCHYQGGLTLKRVRVISRSSDYIERQSGEAARRAFGDLELPDATHPVPREAQALVSQFEQAFIANDKAKLLALAGPYFSTVDTRSKRREHAALVSGATGPLHTFRSRGALPKPQWFHARKPRERSKSMPDWFACYCRDDDCDGRWPIAALDAVSSLDFPYACLRIFNHNNKRVELAFDAIDEPYSD